MEHEVASPRRRRGRSRAPSRSATVVEAGSAAGDAATRSRRVAERRRRPARRRDADAATRSRPDLLELRAPRGALADASRPEAVARRHDAGQRTARENVADLCDAGSFVEYGALAIAAQRARRALEDLIAQHARPTAWSPASAASTRPFGPSVALRRDGLRLHGAGRHAGHAQPPQEGPHARAAPSAAAAGRAVRRGRRRPARRHRHADRRRPATATTFRLFARAQRAWCRWSASSSGRCFAGNAALLGCCDVIIATEDSQHRHGRPGDDRGRRPRRVHARGDRPDATCRCAQRRGRRRWSHDEAEAVAAAQAATCPTSRARSRDVGLRRPARAARRSCPRTGCASTTCARSIDGAGRHRLGARAARAASAPGMITALARIEGRPVGVIANNPTHLGGAIDADARRQGRALHAAVRRASACRSCSLCDTPGFMVGPEVESDGAGAPRQPHVRHRRQPARAVLRRSCCARATAWARRRWPAAASTRRCSRVAWPTGEFGGMGLEGAVRARLPQGARGGAPTAPSARRCSSELVAERTSTGKAINMADDLEIDDVIDPADTPALARARRSSRRACRRAGRPLHRPVVGASGQWCACSAGSAAS